MHILGLLVISPFVFWWGKYVVGVCLLFPRHRYLVCWLCYMILF